MDENEVPVLGPVTVTFSPEQAAELAMVVQHVLYNVPDNPRPDQSARAYTLGEAAIALSGALIKAMHDAGLSDELIARASGHLYRAPQENAAQLELVQDMEGKTIQNGEIVPDDETTDYPEGVHPLDPPTDEPHNPSPPVDFPTPGGPPSAA
jgi:hypothetical protein